MIFFKFILLLFVAALAVIILIAYSFYKQLHRVTRRFRPEDMEGDGQRPNGSAQRTTHVDGNTIVDNRSEKERNKKVIKDNEGEYVDYQ